MRFPLYLGYMRFVFFYPYFFVNIDPYFAFFSPSCFYILCNAQSWEVYFEWEKECLRRDSFYLCALKCIQRYIQNCVVDGFLFGEKVHNQPFVLEILLRTMV